MAPAVDGRRSLTVRVFSVLVLLIVYAGCEPSRPPLIVSEKPPIVFPDSLPRNIAVITFVGDENAADVVTDAFAVGLARLHFYPVRRILIDSGDNDRARIVAASDETTQLMWYEDLVDSLRRMPDADAALQGVFIGSIAGIAQTLNETEDQVMPLGVLNVRFVELSTGRIIWRTSIRDDRVFLSTLALRVSGLEMVRKALQELKTAFQLPGDLRE